MYLQPRATMALDKRDNMGFQIAPSLIIFLVILGSGFLVCCGFAIFRYYGGDADQVNWTKRRPEQDRYMREVRERNWTKLDKNVNKYHHASASRHHARDYAHAPMTPSGLSSTITNG